MEQRLWTPDIPLVDDVSHRDYLRRAYRCAFANSDDPYTKVGAVIVTSGVGALVFGANHFPRGLDVTDELIADRTWKLDHIIHAETAAIHSAARQGIAIEGATMYMPWLPCMPCAKAMADAGIAQLIGHREWVVRTPERWQKSIEEAVALLETCGVATALYTGKVGEVKGLFMGEEWEP